MADPLARLAAIRRGLSPAERARMGAMTATVIGLNVAGWGMLAAALGGHYHISKTTVFGVGTGALAYTLGMRHAFDADHIAAIDNTTRKLVGEGKRPLSVGFFFSLGHSSVVFVLAVLLNFGIRGLGEQLKDGGSHLQYTTNIIGTCVSGFFLFLIAAFNVVILAGILKVFREMRSGAYDDEQLEEQLNKRGLMNRFLGRLAPPGRHAVEDLPGRVPVRPRFRHRDRGGPARAGRYGGRRRAALLCHLVAAGPVRRRDEPVRHDRRLLHEFRLRLGVRPAGPQGLLQHHHHRAVRVRGVGHRGHRVPRPPAQDTNLNGASGRSSRSSTSTRPASPSWAYSS